ncbi:hypothetical protein [Rhodopseudomonas telluris]|uniref:SPOR domain-containing protein n=1 Tax=Rhodopseudomonas telluris TaxID=644215 RepID=A0ABV6EX93_9BRAD
MARNRDDLADSFATDEPGGWLTRFLADEEDFDARSKWRLATWGAGSLGALVIAILATQTSMDRRRDLVAAADLARQSQQIQRLTKESQSEATRLASAIDTLNADRDRLYARLGSLEQGLDSVTGSIARVQATSRSSAGDKALAASLPEIPVKESAPPVATVESKASAPQTSPPASPAAAASASPPAPMPAKRPAEAAATEPPTPSVAAPPVPHVALAPPPQEPEPKRVDKTAVAAMTPPAPLMSARSMLAPPDAAATKLNLPQPADTSAGREADAEPDEAPVAVPRTSFGVELGGANSVDGLRNLWRRMAKAHKELKDMRPIIMVKENASGGQLRLVAGPLDDAAAAAKLCAALGAADRPCETTVFDGQRLPLASTAPPPPRQPRKRPPPKVTTVAPEQPAAPEPPPAPPQPKPGPLSSILGIH